MHDGTAKEAEVSVSAVECLSFDDLPPEDARRVAELSDLVWPPSVRKSHLARFASDPPPPCDWSPTQRARLFVVRDAGQIVTKAGLSPRRILIACRHLTVLALRGVLTHPTYRRRGLGSAVVRAAFSLVDADDFPCALFQTEVPGFYERLGATCVQNPLTNSLAKQPGARPFWEPSAMLYPGGFPLPEGPIDTLGPGW